MGDCYRKNGNSNGKDDESTANIPNSDSTIASTSKKSVPTNAASKLAIKVACWNVRRGLNKTEKEIEEMLHENYLDILFLVETDTTMVMEEKDYKLKGFNTFFLLKKTGDEKTRIVALCKENANEKAKIKLRQDLCSADFPSIWLEVDLENERNI